jgi:cyanoexosortase A
MRFSAPAQILQVPKFWLLALSGCLIALNLHLIMQAKLANLAVTMIIFVGAIAHRLHQRTSTLNFDSGWISKVLGGAIAFSTLFSVSVLPSSDILIRLLPFISALGLALIASGIKGLKQYWQELMLLLVLGIPLERLIDPINERTGITYLIAKFSTFLLWYVGFNVGRDGETIVMPIRATWVGPNCSGVLTMMWMLQLAILFLVMFKTRWHQKILLPIVAVGIVFLLNGVRTAVLAFFAAYNYPAFEFWHSDRAQVFSTIPILLFGMYCRYLTANSKQVQ